MKILIADGNSVSRHMMQEYLQEWGYEIVTAENGRQALEVLQTEHPPQIALLDKDLPQINGVAVCKTLQDSYKGTQTHKILLSDPSELENLLPALESGVNDFYTKPIQVHKLRARLFVAFQSVEVKRAAIRDSLTGLYNRRYFMEQGEREFERAKRHQHPLSIIMFDVDHFKKINDQYGHAIGDVALKTMTQCCQSNLRPEDVLCRWGGEEFVVILPETTGATALQVAERLRKKMSELNVLVEGQPPIKLTASFGVAEMTVADINLQSAINAAHKEKRSIAKDSSEKTHSLEQVHRLADDAAYEAKEAGRNLAVFKKENVSYMGNSFFPSPAQSDAGSPHTGHSLPPQK
jgi:two-component system, cell cycle response regulator